MRGNNRKSIEKCRKKLPQFTTMNVIDGQAGLVIYSSLIFYSLTIDNILNIIVLLILAGVSIATFTGDNGILKNATKAKEENEKAKAKEELAIAVDSMMIEYYNDNKDIFKEDNVMNNINQNLSNGKIEKAKIYYNEKMVDSWRVDELESIYKYQIEDETIYFTISENGKIDYMKKLNDFVQDYDENGISKHAGKWVSYPQQYSNQTLDYIMNESLNGWRILNNDRENTKIVTAGIPARYEYNHNKTIVDDWNDFSKFENTTFTWGIKDIKQLKQEELAIGIRSINYNDIKEVTNDLNYIPSYTNSMWGSEVWPTRLQGLIGCENEYIVATWQNQKYDSLYYMTFPKDEYGMGLSSNGYLYYKGVRVVSYLNKNVNVYESEYFDGSGYKRPYLLVY